jgi:hypothetical protein
MSTIRRWFGAAFASDVLGFSDRDTEGPLRLILRDAFADPKLKIIESMARVLHPSVVPPFRILSMNP